MIRVPPSSGQPPFAGVVCRGNPGQGFPGCGKVDIDEREYDRQMAKPNSLWCCPHCGELAAFDDARFEELNPGPIEEFLFFDHPSGRTRIFAAMRWKAEHRQ